MSQRFPSHRSALTASILALAGCSGGGSSGAGGAAAEALTYYRDAKPILDEKCAGCHYAGGIAPFALTSYDDAKANAAAIQGAVSAGTMPPWPASDACNEYQFDRSLSADQKAILTQWVQGGAAPGDPADAKPVDTPSGGLSRVDVKLSLPVAYTPVIAPDEYRCFLVDWPDTETSYVTGLGVQPGNTSIVHHVIVYLAAPDHVAEYQALDDAEPGPGYTCFGGPNGPASGVASWLGSWVPGVEGVDFPAGTGIAVPAGSKAIIQVHYNTSTAKPAPDQTTVLFKKDPSVEKRAFFMPWADPSWVKNKTMDIPPHSNDVSHSFAKDPTQYLGLLTNGAFANGVPLTIHGSTVHMHTLGTRGSTTIVRQGGGDDCMLDIERWNFHWQVQYWFQKPKTLSPGDQLELDCHWDNPTELDVNWGEGTSDEMCLGVFYVTQ